MNGPLVSVIVPVYQRAALVVQAVRSVFAQTLRDWELIVADDGSTDDSLLACGQLAGSDARVGMLALPHSGNPAAVRNAALCVARGEFVAFLDSDDVWMPDKLERQLAQLRASRTCAWSYTGFEHVDADGALLADGVATRWSPCEGQIFSATVTGQAPIRTASVVMVARALLLAADGFDEELVSGQDYDLWMRLALHHPVAVLPARLTAVRVHSSSHSHRWPPRALECRELSLRKIAGVAGREWQPLIAAQRRRNAAALAASYLAQGAHAAMLASMRRSFGTCWRDPRWWLSSARTLVRSLRQPMTTSGEPLAR
jgi:glycosyltransferase involved in cell wall biosynthesis